MGITTAVIISCVIDLSMGVVGFWLIRPSVREKMEEVWQKKWLDYALPLETGSAYQEKHGVASHCCHALSLKIGGIAQSAVMTCVFAKCD